MNVSTSWGINCPKNPAEDYSVTLGLAAIRGPKGLTSEGPTVSLRDPHMNIEYCIVSSIVSCTKLEQTISNVPC